MAKRKLKLVRVTAGDSRVQGRSIHQDFRSFRVAPACVQAFMRELQAQERIRVTLLRLVRLPRWRRVRFLPRLWILRQGVLERRLGRGKAKGEAWQCLLAAMLARRDDRLTDRPNRR